MHGNSCSYQVTSSYDNFYCWQHLPAFLSTYGREYICCSNRHAFSLKQTFLTGSLWIKNRWALRRFLYSIHEVNTATKSCCEAPKPVLRARGCSLAVTQRAHRSLARSHVPPHATTTARAAGFPRRCRRRRSPDSRGPRRSPQVAARRGASFDGQPTLLARPPGARRGLGLPCGHRSHSETDSRRFRGPHSGLQAPAAGGRARTGLGASGGEGRGRASTAPQPPRRVNRRHRVDGAAQTPLRSVVWQLPAHALDVITPLPHSSRFRPGPSLAAAPRSGAGRVRLSPAPRRGPPPLPARPERRSAARCPWSSGRGWPLRGAPRRPGMAAEESRCLLGYPAADSCPRWARAPRRCGGLRGSADCPGARPRRAPCWALGQACPSVTGPDEGPALGPEGGGRGGPIIVGLFCFRVQNKKLYLATFAAVLGPLSFGFVLGYSSPVIPELRKINDPKLRLDSSQASWFGVSLCMMHSHYVISLESIGPRRCCLYDGGLNFS